MNVPSKQAITTAKRILRSKGARPAILAGSKANWVLQWRELNAIARVVSSFATKPKYSASR